MKSCDLDLIQKYVPDYGKTNKVCPIPSVWNGMYKLMLSLQRLRNIEETPPHPLILHGWYVSDDKKRVRLFEMLEYSDRHELDYAIMKFFEKLSNDDWYFCEVN